MFVQEGTAPHINKYSLLTPVEIGLINETLQWTTEVQFCFQV